MRNVLDPLARIPGVRVAAIISPDGVPIDVRANEPMRGTEGTSGGAPGGAPAGSAERKSDATRPPPTTEQAAAAAAAEESLDEHGALEFGAEDINALAALTSSWISEISRGVAPLSWEVPRRLVLGAARGTLVVVQVPRALLVCVIEAGVRPEEVRLPMGVAIARMERHLRAVELKSGNGKLRPSPAAQAPKAGEPSSIVPSQNNAKPSTPASKNNIRPTGNEVPEASGE